MASWDTVPKKTGMEIQDVYDWMLECTLRFRKCTELMESLENYSRDGSIVVYEKMLLLS